MSEHSPPPSKRLKTDSEDLLQLSKEELIKKLQKQQEYVDQIEAKINTGGDETDDKDKNPVSESSRRENILVMRLANKEQEVQEYAAQISHIKKAQEDTALLSLRQANLDPGVNLLFGKMREELQQTKDKLEQAQSELSAWKFTPDSQNGKKLIARCRTLIAENQELGRQLSQGKSAQLEAELALQKKYSEELKASQDELKEFVIQLDEEVEGMQSTIQILQQQLAAAKQEADDCKKKLNQYPNVMHAKKENDNNSNSNSKLVKTERDCHGSSVSHNRTSNNKANDLEAQNTGTQLAHNLKQSRKAKYSKTIGNTCGNNNTARSNSGGDYCEEIEAISSPGTPTSELMQKDDSRSPGTPTQEQIEYVDDDSDSWSNNRAGDAWDDRTNSRYSDCSSDEAIEEEVENEEVGSENSDCVHEETDDIKAHISLVNPNHDIQFETSDKLSEDVTRNVKKLHNYNTKTLAATAFKNAQHSSSSRANSNIAVDDARHITHKSTGTTDAVNNTSESTIPAVAQSTSIPDQTALLNCCKNNLAQQIIQPDGKTALPGSVAALGAKMVGLQQQLSHELLAQQNTLLTAANVSPFMTQGAYDVQVPLTRPYTGPLNNHTGGIQNGVDGSQISGKSE